jgi:hypothetical protein
MQLFKFRDEYLFADATCIYTLSSTTLTNVRVTAVGNSEVWRIADAGKGRVAVCDGTMTGIRAGDTITWSSMLSWTQIPPCRCMILHRGQFIGIAAGAWATDVTYDSGTVVWSNIGRLDFTLSASNEAGYKKLLSEDALLEVRPLGKDVIVYGQNSITSMTPVTEPAPTFAWDDVATFGLLNKGAIAGSLFEHVFVNSVGDICRLSKKGLEVLGYREYSDYYGSDVIVSYDQLNDRYFIAWATGAYLLTRYGLSWVHQWPSSIITDNNNTYAMGFSSGDTVWPSLQTDILDFGLRAEKTIYSIELGIHGTGTDNFYVQVQWRSSVISTTSDAASWNSTSIIPVNNEGVVNIVISGSEFKINVSSLSMTDWTLSYIKIRYKVTGKKSLHGSYDPKGKGYASEYSSP